MSVALLITKAHELYDSGNYFAARRQYCAALVEQNQSKATTIRTQARRRRLRYMAAVILRHLGDCYRAQGKFVAAEKCYRKALLKLNIETKSAHGRLKSAGAARLHALVPTVRKRTRALARRLWRDIADCRYNRNQIQDALHFYQKAYHYGNDRFYFILKPFTTGRTGRRKKPCIEPLRHLNDIADCARRLGRWNKARKQYEQCISSAISFIEGPNAREKPRSLLVATAILGDALEGLAETYFRQKNYERSKKYFEQALEAKSRVWGSYNPSLRDIWYRLSHINLLASEPSKTIPHIQRLLLVLTRYEPASITTAHFMHTLGQCLAQCRRHAEAVHELEQAALLFEIYLSPASVDLRQCLLALSNSYCWLDRYQDAEGVARKLLQQESLHGLELHTARASRTMGISLSGQRKYAEAEPHHRRAVELFEKIKGQNDPETRAAQEHLERTEAYIHRLGKTIK